MKTDPFQRHSDHYDNWFEQNRFVYEAELKAVASVLPRGKRGVEIGAGTGRFAVPLGVWAGIEPAGMMGAAAKKRGLNIVAGVAEQLPVKDAAFDYALMVTTICFLDDLEQALREAFRILPHGGFLIIGFVDRNSPIGQSYVKHRHESVFYREATFYSVDEVIDAMEKAGFGDFSFRQTIFRELPDVAADEPVEPGYGKGSFVVVSGRKM